MSIEAKKPKRKKESEYRKEQGIQIGMIIVKVPLDMAKLLAWKAVKLRQDIAETVGINAVINKLKFFTPKCVQRKLRKWRNKIPVHKYEFILGRYKYTISTGRNFLVASKSYIRPRDRYIKPKRKLKDKISTAFYNSNAKISRTFHNSNAKISKAFHNPKASLSNTFSKANLAKMYNETKSNIKNAFKKIPIPPCCKSYFQNLGKNNNNKKIINN